MFGSKEEWEEFEETRDWQQQIERSNLENWEVYDFGYLGEDHILISNADSGLSSKFIFRFIAFLLITGYFIGKLLGTKE